MEQQDFVKVLYKRQKNHVASVSCFFLSLFFLLALLPSRVEAEVYTWRDAEGKLHVSDKKPNKKQAEEYVPSERNISISSTPVSNSVGSEAMPAWVEEINKQQKSKGTLANNPKVVMYSTSWCGYCKKMRKYFQRKNISFTEYDIEKSSTAYREYKRLNGKGVPLISVGEKVVRGYNPGLFEEYYY